MPKITLISYGYIFFCDGDIFEQDFFTSDEEALEHARKESEHRGKRILVARWLEKDNPYPFPHRPEYVHNGGM